MLCVAHLPVIAPDMRRRLCEARLFALLVSRVAEALTTQELREKLDRLHRVDDNNNPYSSVQA